jgi:hypothetical protein
MSEHTIFDTDEELEVAQMFLSTLAGLRIFNYWIHLNE